MQGRQIRDKLGEGKGQVKRQKGRKRVFALDTSSGLLRIAILGGSRCYLFPQECAESRLMCVQTGKTRAARSSNLARQEGGGVRGKT